MTPEDFRLLLYRGESESLDFKRDQYRLSDDHQKAELIKDCIAFANSWRRECGYIVIGVKKSPGQALDVCGIESEDHLDDANLQQIVNQKVNIPIRMGYEELEYEGKSVGVIRFDHPQKRPVYLKKDLGNRLVKHAVYIRRGSCTAICEPAEIADMGRGVQDHGSLNFALGFSESGNASHVCTEGEAQPLVVQPDNEVLAAQTAAREGSVGGLQARSAEMLGFDPRILGQYNKVAAVAQYAQFCMCIKNTGTRTASSVDVEVKCEAPPGVSFASQGLHPRLLVCGNEFMDIGAAVGANSRHRNSDGVWIMNLNCSELHPGQIFSFDPLYVSSESSADLALRAKVFARDLDLPPEHELQLRVRPRQEMFSRSMVNRFLYQNGGE